MYLIMTYIASDEVTDNYDTINIEKVERCIHIILNISNEEKDQLASLINTDTADINCNATNTVNLMVSSLTYVTMNNDEMESHERRPADDIMKSTRCTNPNTVERITVGLVLILLISLIIVLSAVLIYIFCCHKKCRQAASLVLRAYRTSSYPGQLEPGYEASKQQDVWVGRRCSIQAL